ncbi:ISKra4 family transposase [Nocardia sp. NPDC059177]|uniref:ISKra4 family transposase n=1 Tax=Nocardia sp. NPDC059177 TaxID=3346759 RepID=UPI00369699DB
MPGYPDAATSGTFGRSRQLFADLEAELTAPATDGLTHDELEDLLSERGRTLMRQLFQDRADLRACREQRRSAVTDTTGVTHNRVEPGHATTLTTVFGPVTATRIAYRAPGASNLHPADAHWNTPTGTHSHGLRRLIATETPRGSFESAQAGVKRATGVRVGKRQIADITVAAAIDIPAFYTGRHHDPTSDPDKLLILTSDGKGVVMRPEALRPATAKAAAASGPRLSKRTSPGEKTGRKRMAELACVYDLEPRPRTPADISTSTSTSTSTSSSSRGEVRATDGESKHPRAAHKWMTASITANIPAVIATMFDEAERRDPTHQRSWVALVDGNNTQIEAITTEAQRRGIDVGIVIDFVHVTEYIWKAAWTFFTPADPDAQDWVSDKLSKVLAGQARSVAAGIRRRASRYYADHERKGADQAATYLTNKAGYLRYDEALAAGWPIATGVIEGACRYIVKDRLDITGARWGLAGAEAVLRLRALHSNGDFDEYWRFHLRQEHRRNHLDRYQQSRSDYELAS